MSFFEFKRIVGMLADKSGSSVTRCFQDNGRYIAKFDNADGVTVIGNSIAKKIEILWGSGHRAYYKAC